MKSLEGYEMKEGNFRNFLLLLLGLEEEERERKEREGEALVVWRFNFLISHASKACSSHSSILYLIFVFLNLLSLLAACTLLGR